MTRTSLVRMIWGLVFLFGGEARAAVTSSKADITRPNRILSGGETRTALSLLALNLEDNKKKAAERIKLVWGNSVMEPWKGSPGYFHIEYRGNQKDAVIELARTTTSFADLKNLKRQLLQSKSLRDVTVDVDRITQNLIVHLKFKKPVQLSAATGKDEKAGAYLAIDFRAEAAAGPKAKGNKKK